MKYHLANVVWKPHFWTAVVVGSAIPTLCRNTRGSMLLPQTIKPLIIKLIMVYFSLQCNIFPLVLTQNSQVSFPFPSCHSLCMAYTVNEGICAHAWRRKTSPYSSAASHHLFLIAPHRVGQLRMKPAGQGSLAKPLKGTDPAFASPKAAIHTFVQECKQLGSLSGIKCYLVQSEPLSSADGKWEWQHHWILSPGLETSQMRFTFVTLPVSAGNTC